MLVLTVALAVVAAVCTAVIFGTDVLGAVVMRPAYAEIDDEAMVQIVGRSHRLGGQRLPVPGVVSVVAAALTTGSALVAGWLAAGLAAAVGLVLLLAWLVIFNRISLPINKVLIAASEAGETPADARSLQARWDSVITLRAVLQGTALVGFCLAIALAGR
ncbi:DUF1772 domain-containing protein [Dactylosporangium siamense]|uniref:DUF1772 domain-containing protein n=1 Tax=Dactylosporangium siamense TaxID=685454 RepID=A0A919PRR9_9ACTN|nr:DUF1772 domain-containing protein [Dactylosporangium siamense]GIG49027.1 hypothetical protein Dsi01nite_070680 [Dactylosporangium siamense]